MKIDVRSYWIYEDFCIMKPTKRKGFNFLRSYFDAFNLIPEDKDKLDFLVSIINKQFLDEDPEDLGLLAKLSYEGQRHSIEKSVKGYKDKMKTDLLGNSLQTPKQPPYKPPTEPPCQQVQEEVQEKEEEEDKLEIIVVEDLPIIKTPKETNLTEEVFLKRWCDARAHYDKMPTNITKLTTYEKIDFNELKQDYELIDFEKAMQGLFQQKTFPKTRLRPTHFLKRENFEPYLTCFTTKEKLFDDKKYVKPKERI